MTFTEKDLSEMLADRSRAVLVPPDLAATVERKGRSRRRRNRFAAGAALVAGAATAALVVADLNSGSTAGRDVFSKSTSAPAPGHGQEVPPPVSKHPSTPELRAALSGVIKVTATARDCLRHLEGTGFVYAPERVMTLAHVVAGARGRPEVQLPHGVKRKAQVVLYDPRRDIAVLYVPGLPTPPLKFNRAGKAGDPALIAGFPKSKVTSRADIAAQIRARQRAQGPDIYHSGHVNREIFAVRGRVEPGLSGAPLLAADGAVYGVIFAAALNDNNTGYALTAREVAADAQAGRTATQPVSTGRCSD
jgi:S1-C subfamily serine protease